MARVRFTRRCFEEDLQQVPRHVAAEALDAAEALEKNPEIGGQLYPPFEAFRRLRIGRDYRLIYTHDLPSDTWWIVLLWQRKPGKPTDVYKILGKLVAEGLGLK